MYAAYHVPSEKVRISIMLRPLCSPVSSRVSAVSSSSLLLPLRQKTRGLEVVKRFPQVQGKLQRPEAPRPLDSPREAGAQADGQVARPQPGHDGDPHPSDLTGHHAGRQQPRQQPPPAAEAQLLPWLVSP